jgi:hypothetical protein
MLYPTQFNKLGQQTRSMLVFCSHQRMMRACGMCKIERIQVPPEIGSGLRD